MAVTIALTFLLSGSTLVFGLDLVSASWSPDGSYPAIPEADEGNYTYIMDLNDPISVRITGYVGAGGVATIPSTIGGYPVLMIEVDAFSGNANLTSITIPSSVTTIGYGAFTNCRYLTAINVDPVNAKYASIDGVLYDKSITTLIKYPGGKTGAFAIPNSVTSISDWAFSGHSSLVSVIIPGSVVYIGKNAFSYCSVLSSLSLGYGVQRIDDSAFVSCGDLKSIVLPDSVDTTIGNVFAQCVKLENVTLSRNLTTISTYSFSGCQSLRSVIIPGKVTNVEIGAFAGCSNLTVLFEGDAPSAPGWENYHSKVIVNYYVGSSGFTSPMWNGVRSVQLNAPGAKPVEMIITSDYSKSILGNVLAISGKMQIMNSSQGIAGLDLSIAYGINNGTVWTVLPYIVSTSDGTFTTSWLPPSTGVYLLNITYEGSAQYWRVVSLLNVALAVSSNNDTFTVQSNSTITNLSVNSTSKELSFTVSGEPGTSGYAKITVSKSLVPNGNDVKITLDGANLSYELNSTETSWIMMFTYHHSSHDIVADLNIKPSATSSGDGTILIMVLIAITILLMAAIIVLRKRNKGET